MIDEQALGRDAAAMVQVPSVTGDELSALQRLAELARSHGLEPDLHQHDLAALRAHPDHPGEEAARTELWGLTVTVPGSEAHRMALNGHVDVVGPGTVPWSRPHGTLEDGR